MYTIYKATNKINGKSYIGVTVNFNRRMKEHQYRHKEKTTSKFYRAIRKYGWGNFQWETIYTSNDWDFTYTIMENYFIRIYDTYKNGYNMTFGGEGTLGNTYKHSQETKERLRKQHLGKSQTKETKQKISKSLEGNDRGRVNKGKSYEQLYGDDADRLKDLRRKNMIGQQYNVGRIPWNKDKKYKIGSNDRLSILAKNRKRNIEGKFI